MSNDELTPDNILGEGKTCFIVGPIGSRLDPVGSAGRLIYENATQMWENVFEPACKHFALTPVRADKISQSGDIPEQIFTYLRDAEVVIADVTGGNANVMYELGLRHSRDLLTLQVGEHQRLPFDVNTVRTIQFNRTEAGLIDARNTIIEFLRAGLQGEATPVAATRIYTEGDLSLDPATVASQSELSYQTEDPGDIDVEDGPGRLDQLADGELAIEELGGVLSTFTEHMIAFGGLATDYTPKVEAASSFTDQLSVLRQYLNELKPVAENMDSSAVEYLGTVEKIDSAIQIIIQEFEEEPEKLHEPELADFVASIIGMCRVVEESAVGVTQNLHLAREMRAWSNIVRPVSKTLEHAFNTTLRAVEIVVGWSERFRAIPGWVEPPPMNFEIDDDQDGTDD